MPTVQEANRGTGADDLVVKPPARDRRKSRIGGRDGERSLVTRRDRDGNERQKRATHEQSRSAHAFSWWGRLTARAQAAGDSPRRRKGGGRQVVPSQGRSATVSCERLRS